MRRFSNLLPLLLVALSLLGCTPATGDAQQTPTTVPTLLQEDTTASQTITTYYNGLDGIDVFLLPGRAGRGDITLHLRTNAADPRDLAVASLPLTTIDHAGYYRFTFPVQHDSRHRDYVLLLQVRGSGSVAIGTVPGDAYLDGAFSHNGVPQDLQLDFRPHFAPRQVLVGCIQQSVAVWLPVLLVSLLLYIVPGWALLTLLWPTTRPLIVAEKAGLAAGLSLALYPLLLLWSNLAGLRLGPLYAWAPVLLALLALVWHHRTWRPALLVASWRQWRGSAACWPDVALLVVLGIIFALRLTVIAPLDVPLWGDSYHHTMIAQLLVDNGGLFDTWHPYADLTTFTYHFGFHAAVAAFHWMTGSAMPQAVLWVGQVLNGLAVLAIYPLTLRIGGNRWAGVVAVLLAGLLSPMPLAYLNWGRYTQLAGQVILPAVAYLVWGALELRERNWRVVVLVWVVLGGLALTHYRVLVFFAPFLVAFVLVEAQWGTVRPLLLRMFVLLVGGGLLALPWYLTIFAGKLASVIKQSLIVTAAQSTAAKPFEELNAVGNLSTYLPMWVWLLFVPAFGWGLWKRQRGVAVLALWWFGALLIVNPQWLHLPGAGLLTSFALFIAAYIPVGTLIGVAAGWLVGEPLPLRRAAVLLVAVMVVALWGVWQRADDINIEQHALVTRADVRAFDWIEQHTDADARFLVNAFFTYNGTVVVGSDGGWWLPLLAHRQTMLPPITYNSEQGDSPQYKQSVNELVAVVSAHGFDHPEVQALLHERGITHIYIGQRQGRVNTITPLLNPQTLLESPHTRLVYQHDRVVIFELVGGERMDE